MTAYIPALIWLLSGLACLLIAKRRHVKSTAIRAMLVALLGPIAIPFVLAAKPELYGLNPQPEAGRADIGLKSSAKS
jgi:hypothetical protein